MSEKSSAFKFNVVSVFVLLVISFLEFHVVRITETLDSAYLIQFSSGIVHGTPLERIFQNRLLGPLFIEGISKATRHSYSSSYKIGLFILLALSNVICNILIVKLSGNRLQGLIWTAAFAAVVVALQDEFGMYIFDPVDLSTMLVFAYAVLYERDNLKILIPLFFIELLNRESAGFIGLWLIISAVSSMRWGSTKAREPGRLFLRAMIGGALLVLGSLWTSELRRLLFKHSFKRSVGLDLGHANNGEHFVLKANLHNFIHPTSPGFLISLICCGALILLVRRLIALEGPAAYSVASMVFVIVISVWMFGNVDETRIWIALAPFGLMLAYATAPRNSIEPTSCKLVSGASSNELSAFAGSSVI